MKFRKKPITIEAIQTSEALAHAIGAWEKLPAWLHAAYEVGTVIFATDHVSIRTLEGEMRADRDDWIIRGVKGELYPCKPDIFEATYAPVES